MAGMSDYLAKAVLGFMTGSLAMPSLPQVWMGLFTGAPTSDAGTGGTEVSGGSYARQQIAGSINTSSSTPASGAGANDLHFSSVPSWVVPGMYIRNLTHPGSLYVGTTVLSVTATDVVMNQNAVTTGGGVSSGDTIVFAAFNVPAAASGNEPQTAPAQTLNDSAIVTFPTATAAWGTVVAYGLFDAASGGNLLGWDFLGGFNWLPFTCSNASPAVITAPNHGYNSGDLLVVSQKFGGGLPVPGSGFDWGGYHTVANVFDADTFTTEMNTTSTGSGMIRKVQKLSVPNGNTPTFNTTSLLLTLA